MQATWELRAAENGTGRLRNVYGMNEVERNDIELVCSYGGRSLAPSKARWPSLYSASYAPRSLHHAILEGHKYGHRL